MHDIDNTIVKLTENTHFVALAVLFPKKLKSCSMRNFGFSSRIQCPERATMPPRTFVDIDCIESNGAVPKLFSPPRAKTGIGSLTLEYSLICSASIGMAL